jgi:hypothetical protein
VIYPGSTPVGNATLVVANVLKCNKLSQYLTTPKGLLRGACCLTMWRAGSLNRVLASTHSLTGSAFVTHRPHRLSEKGLLSDIVEEWEEWQHDQMLRELQAHNKALQPRQARKHKRDEAEVDPEAPRQVSTTVHVWVCLCALFGRVCCVWGL